MIEKFSNLIADARVAAGAALTTSGSGIAQWLDMLPSTALTKGATLIGIILSTVLIVVHIRRDRREAAKMKLELDIMRQTLTNKGPE